MPEMLQDVGVGLKVQRIRVDEEYFAAGLMLFRDACVELLDSNVVASVAEQAKWDCSAFGLPNDSYGTPGSAFFGLWITCRPVRPYCNARLSGFEGKGK